MERRGEMAVSIQVLQETRTVTTHVTVFIKQKKVCRHHAPKPPMKAMRGMLHHASLSVLLPSYVSCL